MRAALAYKFLRPGGVGPFSRFAWPLPHDRDPGPWVEASRWSAMCRDGIHACSAEDLPRWIWEDLWVVELDGEVEHAHHKLRAPRGRLVRQVTGWTATTAKAFAEACAWRARDHALEALGRAGADEAVADLAGARDLEDVRAATARHWDQTPAAARIPMGMASDGAIRALTARAADSRYVAANGGAVSAYIAAATAGRAQGRAALEAERAWQAAWLAERLGLEPR